MEDEERRKSLLICSFERKSASSCGSSSNKTSSHQLDHRCWLHPQDSFLFLLIFFPQRLACWLLIFFLFPCWWTANSRFAAVAVLNTRHLFPPLFFSPLLSLHHFHHSHHHLFLMERCRRAIVCVCVCVLVVKCQQTYLVLSISICLAKIAVTFSFPFVLRKNRQIANLQIEFKSRGEMILICADWFFLLLHLKFTKMVLLLSLQQKQYYNNNFA